MNTIEILKFKLNKTIEFLQSEDKIKDISPSDLIKIMKYGEDMLKELQYLENDSHLPLLP